MSLPIIRPTVALGDYLWDTAVECQKVGDEWNGKHAGSGESVLAFADMLFESDAHIAACRLRLSLDGRWSYDRDDYR